jgi:hypothetical protein
MRHRPKTLRLPNRPGKEGDVVACSPGASARSKAPPEPGDARRSGAGL